MLLGQISPRGNFRISPDSRLSLFYSRGLPFPSFLTIRRITTICLHDVAQSPARFYTRTVVIDLASLWSIHQARFYRRTVVIEGQWSKDHTWRHPVTERVTRRRPFVSRRCAHSASTGRREPLVRPQEFLIITKHNICRSKNIYKLPWLAIRGMFLNNWWNFVIFCCIKLTRNGWLSSHGFN